VLKPMRHVAPDMANVGGTASLHSWNHTSMVESKHFFIEYLRLAKLFWCSSRKLKIRGSTFFLAILTIGQMILAVFMTKWSAGLFNALEQHSMRGLMTQVGMLAIQIGRAHV